MRVSKKVREDVKQKFDEHCAYCGIVLNGRWEIDHLEPLIRNQDGSCKYPCRHNYDNLMPSCPSCNRDKKSLSLEQWRSHLYNKILLLNSNSSTYKIALRFGLVEEIDKEIIFYFEEILING